MHRLDDAALMAGWPMPTGLSFADSHRPGNNRNMNATMGLLAGWTTPQVGDFKGPADAEKRGRKMYTLDEQAALAGWATPRAQERQQRNSRDDYEALSRQVRGVTASSFPVPTADTGALNPAHSRWLMGFPETWDEASPGHEEWRSVQRELTASAASAATETPSCPNSPPSSCGR